MKKIVIGADHKGFVYKKHIIHNMKQYQWVDYGAYSEERTDYPRFAYPVCKAIENGIAEKGILICGTGIGMSIIANRFSKVYAALVWNVELARKSKEDDNANVLIIPSQYVKQSNVISIISSWISATFKKGTYQNRIDMIKKYTQSTEND